MTATAGRSFSMAATTTTTNEPPKRAVSQRAEGELRDAWEAEKFKETDEQLYWDAHAQKRFAAETTKLWDQKIPALRLEWTTSGTAQSFPALLDQTRTAFDRERADALAAMKKKRFARYLDADAELQSQWAAFRSASEEAGLLYSSSDDDADDDADADADQARNQQRKKRAAARKERRKKRLSRRVSKANIVPELAISPALKSTAAAGESTGFMTPPSTARKFASTRIAELHAAIEEAKALIALRKEKYDSEMQRNRELILISLGFEA
ncbi:MAG: hypothetical protein CTY36_17035 [Methylocystis sp.]|nr:MAG: hypothetical protein CTY36_17035 [Methylocystis sp.]